MVLATGESFFFFEVGGPIDNKVLGDAIPCKNGQRY